MELFRKNIVPEDSGNLGFRMATTKEMFKFDSIESLDRDDLLFFMGTYNNYIVDFDYKNSGQPVCVYEFFENEFQEILEEQGA